MKKTLFPLLAALAFTVGTAMAQDGRPAQGRPDGDPSERMTKELGLSPDQAARIKTIENERRQEMQASRGQGKPNGSREEMETRMKADRAKYDARYKEVLTPEQYTKYNQMQAQHQGGKGPDGKAKGKGPDGDGKLKAKKNGKVKVKESAN